jgi:ribosome-associated heat shock protein Hsp15
VALGERKPRPRATVAGVESTRVDRWLWAVRIFPTRTSATSACDGGHVKINDVAAKPAAKIKPGDRVEAFAGRRLRILEVVAVIDKRVGAPVAVTCFADHSPPPPSDDDPFAGVSFRRDPGTGRPTKRDRRQLDEFRRG